MEKDIKALLVFYGITLPVSLIMELILIYTGAGIFMSLLMWVPGITGIICANVFYPKQKAIGLTFKIKPLYVIAAFVIPVLYLVPSYLVSWLILKDPTAGLDVVAGSISGGMAGDAPAWIVILISLPLLFFASAMTATGEELGWRGFAYPVLQRVYGPKRAVLINSFIWALWHIPMMIGGVYQAAVNPVYGVISFIVMVMLISICFCWTRSVSGSVIPAIILHSVHNAIDQAYLQPLSTDAKVPYLAGEQGILTILFAAIISVIVILSWSRKLKASSK
ncbi:MAG: CPBP family intramembrane metalloprotease [Clostridiales bacterium]|nr:CPBP family intramembrane metalloprotease [Clostridiales bacterium]